MQDADIVGLATLISAEIRPTAAFSGRLNAPEGQLCRRRLTLALWFGWPFTEEVA